MRIARYDDDWRSKLKKLLSELQKAELAHQRVRNGLLVVLATQSDVASVHDTICGVQRGEFKNRPYIAISRGKLLDGRNGAVKKSKIAPGALALDWAHLLLHGSIHEFEVVAHQAGDGSGTMITRRRNAESTISKLNSAIQSTGLVLEKKDGPHAREWVLTRVDQPFAEFSVDLAAALANRAVDEMHTGNAVGALSKAVEALECDDFVQSAHETACQAAIQSSSANVDVAARLAGSVMFLKNRIEQLNRALQISENSLPREDDEDARADIELFHKKFTEERERLQRLIADTTECFGPFDQGSPKDRPANEAIQELRSRNLTFEQAWGHPLFTRVLGHPSVGWPLDEIVKQAKARGRDEQTALRDRVKAEILTLVLDPGARPNIRWICKAVKHLIPQILEPGTSPVPADVRNYEEAVDAFKKEHGRPPHVEDPEDVEELSGLSSLSPSRLKTAAEWRTLHRHEELEAFDRQQRTKRRSDDSYGDDDDDRGDDEDDDEEGLAGRCVPQQ